MTYEWSTIMALDTECGYLDAVPVLIGTDDYDADPRFVGATVGDLHLTEEQVVLMIGADAFQRELASLRAAWWETGRDEAASYWIEAAE